MNSKQQYDISIKNREVLEFKARTRAESRYNFITECYHPQRTGELFDIPQIRFESTHKYSSRFFEKAHSWRKGFLCLLFLIPIYADACHEKYKRYKTNEALRTGAVPYEAHPFKFARNAHRWQWNAAVHKMGHDDFY
ncbi:uncharacterized protein [Prorops nasuta]|uniref:uncharacterized protein n=1 Tax=Prorops nasuta TaxID=863751 RepID=UPI0034CDB425